MTPRLLTLALTLATPSAFTGPTLDCANGCANRQALDRLSQAPPASFGGLYDNSRAVARPPGALTVSDPRTRAPQLTTPPVGATRKAVPAPLNESGKKEDEEGGGIMGFLNKHKWNIAGSIIGTVAGLLLGGGLFGALIGIAVGLAISFLGPKIFSGKK